MYTTAEVHLIKTFGDTVNRLAGIFVLRPLRVYTANILCNMFTAASGVVAFEQERQHEGVIQKTKFLSIFLMVEVNGDKFVLYLYKQCRNKQGQNLIG